MSLINIALLVKLFENFLYLLFMILVRCTDKFVIGCVHQIPDSLNLRRHSIHKFFRSYARFLCFQFDLLSMFVCSCLEKHIISLLSFKTRDTVCQNHFISVADMRFARCIGNRSCHIKFFFCHFVFLLSHKKPRLPLRRRGYFPCYHFYSSRPRDPNLIGYTSALYTRYPAAITGGTCRSLAVWSFYTISENLQNSSVRLSEAIFHQSSCIPLSRREFSVTEITHVLSSSQCFSSSLLKRLA